MTGWTQVSAGSGNTCAVRSDATLWCWGANGTGQLGVGDTTGRRVPTQVGGAAWASFDTGPDHICALKTDGTRYCWGANDTGQLGIGDSTATDRLTPVMVSSRTSWTRVAMATGGRHACGQAAGVRYCWGLGAPGLGVGDLATRTTPSAVFDGPWTGLSAGFGHTCGIRNTHLYCWGEGPALGLDTDDDAVTPALIAA
ncbi:hypothetical protein [Dactylosporangium sp. NPDC006015]|uniref:RCC1 domain-containing protein n=1 Tax=Dactylosporangium sp. NPDC006015 TaxID=3154576 RepID=UPI0033A925CC